MNAEDNLVHRIAALSGPPLPPDLAARVHARALAAFATPERPPGLLAGAVTAVAVLAATAVYLTWAIDFLSALARG
jgi:hypothetical protein